ncbi:unnamed protein product, partial [Discosporangium mesarthrocarpum]
IGEHTVAHSHGEVGGVSVDSYDYQRMETSIMTEKRHERSAQWMEDASSSSCLLCGAAFTFTNRRHHCRFCLRLVCSACSGRVHHLGPVHHHRSWSHQGGHPSGGGGTKKRVCDTCYASLVATREKKIEASLTDNSSSGKGQEKTETRDRERRD